MKDNVLAAIKILNHVDNNLNIKTLTTEKLYNYKSLITQQQFELLKANIRNRQLTQEARFLLNEDPMNHREFGKMLTAHQNELRDGLRISTPKIDRMIDAALQAGAFGAKINGSGGGGCMFAYAPDSYEKVAKAISKNGGKPYIISVDEGAKFC